MSPPVLPFPPHGCSYRMESLFLSSQARPGAFFPVLETFLSSFSRAVFQPLFGNGSARSVLSVGFSPSPLPGLQGEHLFLTSLGTSREPHGPNPSFSKVSLWSPLFYSPGFKLWMLHAHILDLPWGKDRGGALGGFAEHWALPLILLDIHDKLVTTGSLSLSWQPQEFRWKLQNEICSFSWNEITKLKFLLVLFFQKTRGNPSQSGNSLGYPTLPQGMLHLRAVGLPCPQNSMETPRCIPSSPFQAALSVRSQINP